MALFRLPLAFLLLTSAPLCAQKMKTEDMVREVQRDLVSVQEDVRRLNSKFDEKLAIIQTMLQQAVTEASSANKNVAILDRQLRDSVKEQQNLVAAPVAVLGTKVDQMTQEYATVNEHVKDLSIRMQKLQAQMNDVLTAVKTMQAPAAPPPTNPAASGGTGPPPGVTPTAVYEQALKDKEGGNFDLALVEFNDFLKFFPNEGRAPNAQFYIGEIFYYKKDYDASIEAFDAVLEKYPENSKTPDAMFLKGKALVTSDRKAKGTAALKEVVAKYPNTESGRKARDLLRGITPQATTKKSRR